MSWRMRGHTSYAHGEILHEESEDERGALFRCVLVSPVMDTATNPHDAKRRLADKLEWLAKELRK